MKIWPSLLLLFCACVYAVDVPLELGRDKKAAGDITGLEPKASRALIDARALGDTTEPLDTRRLYERLRAVKPDLPITTRGAKEVALYSRLSSSVVLVLTNDGSGSGSLISVDGKILTNWHVVRGAREVGVVFKPAIEGRKLKPSDVRRATILRVDEVADLALLQVAGVPATVKPLELATMAEAQVGADVHAIGHPTGESWTYTKGFVSQVRKGYEWATESGVKHRAEVIQTQTPINPGNSGGPLLSESGRIVGVNSFKTEGEALNFAVSVTDVRRFLAATQDRRAERAGRQQPVAQAPTECKPKELTRSRNKANNADVVLFDLTCDGVWDAIYTVPDDQREPITFQFDSKNTGLVDIVVLDIDRDGKWDISYHDTVGDGKPHLVGRHPDGALKPSRFEVYVAPR